MSLLYFGACFLDTVGCLLSFSPVPILSRLLGSLSLSLFSRPPPYLSSLLPASDVVMYGVHAADSRSNLDVFAVLP